MTQFARPASDISAGGWTDEGSSFNDGNLYTSIQEVSQDGDTSYILCEVGDGTCEVKLGTVTDPTVGTGHIVHVYAEGVGSGAPERIDIELYQAGVLKATVASNWAPGRGAYADINYTLSGAEADSISDYADLRVRIIEDTLSGSDTIKVTQVYMEIPSLAVVNQTFRIRLSDTVGLNVDSDWAAAIGVDASMAAMNRFRIRFEVEETGGGSFSSALKVQYRKNAGSWTDVDFYNETSPATTPAVWCVLSGQYADLDNTTDILSNSAETFTAGDGNEDPDTVTVTLSNQHTEHEFAFMIPTFYDGPNQNVATDTFEFRLVESDGTIFGGSYDNPLITLTVPTGHIGGTFVETPNRVGPFADGNGNLYFIIEPAETDNVMMMIKSTNGGDTWAEMDGSNRPTLNDLEGVDCQQIGTSLHIAHHSDTEVHYHEFLTSDDASADTWNVTDTVVENAMDGTLDQQVCAIVVRSDGDIIVFYSKHDTGSGDDRLHYRINTGGGFGSTIDLEVEAGFDWTAVSSIIGESDLTHIYYKGNDGVNGPVYHRSLSSADSLSGREAIDANAGQAIARKSTISEVIYWDDGGEENILCVYQDTDDIGYSVAVKDDASPDARRQLSTTTIENDPGTTTSRQMVASLCQDGEDAYFVFSDQSTNDLWYNVMTNDGGWGTEIELIDALPTVHWVKANVFTHSVGNGGAKVVGFIYDTGSDGHTGFADYGELEIVAAATLPFYYTVWRRLQQT